MTYDELIQFLVKKREEQGLSFSQVARKVGKTKAAVAQWEYGKSRPTPDALNDWARAFGYRIVMAPIQQDSGTDALEVAAVVTELPEDAVRHVIRYAEVLASASETEREMLTSMVDLLHRRHSAPAAKVAR